jgi:hypothetical protein
VDCLLGLARLYSSHGLREGGCNRPFKDEYAETTPINSMKKQNYEV